MDEPGHADNTRGTAVPEWLRGRLVDRCGPWGTPGSMSDDPQDQAESVDEDLIGGEDNAVTSDEVEVDFPPDRPQGILFADADVTDESMADRVLQEEPEVWAAAPQPSRRHRRSHLTCYGTVGIGRPEERLRPAR